MDRRRFLAAAATAVAGTSLLPRVARAADLGAAAKIPITVYKSPLCGCCKEWVKYLEGEGFAPTVREQDDDAMDRTKVTMGVPQSLWSCHTAVLGRYIVEGHVPAEDLRRLLAEKPAVLGVSAAGMPQSAPGMARPGQPKQAYDVTAWKQGGATMLFARH